MPSPSGPDVQKKAPEVFFLRGMIATSGKHYFVTVNLPSLSMATFAARN